jgi:3'-5' exoribonuclease
MAKKLIQEFRTGEPIDEMFVLSKRELKMAKNGAYYMALTLSDRSGSVDAKMWDASPTLYEALSDDSFVRIKGKTETFNEKMQFNVRLITLVEAKDVDLADYLPRSERDPKEMFAELKKILSQVEDKDYRALCAAFINDDQFRADFCKSPAAIKYHHAYLGGLLEHTLGILNAAVALLPLYPILRKDLLLTAGFLHDIGKTRELRHQMSFAYTDAGQLVGHVVLGVLMLEERARGIKDFPEEKLNLLRHSILSHHGEYEFGSPKLPMTPEALAVHYLDNLDAKLKDFAETVSEDVQTKSNWTEYVPQLQRRLYKK